MTIARRIKGMRKTAVVAPAPLETTQSQYSVSQLSFDQRTGNFAQMIEFLQNTLGYTPNETEFKITTLQSEKDQLLQFTQRVADTYIPLSMARTSRNQTMYTGKKNLVDTFNIARNYLDSTFYKAIAKIKFTKVIP